LPKGGNGWGAVAAGSQATQGALGLGEQIANATSQSFSLIAYCLPLVVGYLADSRFGRYPMIFWGIILCGIGHVLIVAGGAKTLIENDTAKIPFFIGVYILAVGAGEFGANSTTLVFKTDTFSSHVQAQRHSSSP
jgi:dipeptide/tripeptide permease